VQATDPVREANEPAEQLLHCEAPETDDAVPSGQGEQELEPAVETNDPAGQGSHDEAPDALEIDPAAQREH